MGRLDEAAFDALCAAGCGACGATRLVFRSYVEGSLPTLGGDPCGQMKWTFEGEDFIDGVFEVACGACKHVVFTSDDCPRCNGAGRLAKALESTNDWPLPPGCPICKLEEVRVSAYVPVRVVWEGKRTEKPRTTTELFDPGFHAFRIACADCGPVAELTGSCPVCRATS
jgi:hypothetical protein